MATASRQWARRAVTVLLVAALFWPVIRNDDGLPLSTYPMYAGTRSNIVSLVVAVGVTPDGESTLSMPTIAETRDPLIAQAFLNDVVRRGSTAQVCLEIAGRAGGGTSEIIIATEQHDVIKRVRGEPSLIGREVHERCEVP